MSTEGINGGNEMRLEEILQVVHGEYKVVCAGKELDSTKKLDEKNLIVKSIAATDGVIHIQVEKQSSVKNDLNEEWVKEHIEKYGAIPNIFDGC